MVGTHFSDRANNIQTVKASLSVHTSCNSCREGFTCKTKRNGNLENPPLMRETALMIWKPVQDSVLDLKCM